MKARVKATGEIGIVSQIDVLLKDDFVSFSSNKVEILQSYADATIEPDYWMKLEHQYAGMAMQGLLANHYITDRIDVSVLITEAASSIAHALVEKMKEERK